MFGPRLWAPMLIVGIRRIIAAAALITAIAGPAQASSLTISNSNANVISLTATATDSAATGDNLTLSNSDVTATNFIILNAGDNLLVDAASTLTAANLITLNIDFGNADPGVGATATLAGTLTAPSVILNGGPDFDTLNFLSFAGVLMFDPADPLSGTISAPGFSVITFHNIDSVTGTVTPAPEPTTLVLLGLGAAGIGARSRRRRS